VTRWLLLLPLTVPIFAQSKADDIWQRRDPRQAFLFQDNRARNVGDIVTVIVNESTNTNEREQRALDKNSDASGNISFAGSSSAGGGAGRTGALNFSLTDVFRRRFNGSAQLTSNRVFQDRIAATVVDIMPNGNLVIEGFRSRVLATEERVIRLTGIVRQQDIGTGNTVQSSSIANLRVSSLGRGPATRTVNQNYFGRIMNRAWPW
jgi:flagellar L-ring protein FlgH